MERFVPKIELIFTCCLDVSGVKYNPIRTFNHYLKKENNKYYWNIGSIIFLAVFVSLNWNGFSPSNNPTNNTPTPTQTPTASPTPKSTNTNISVQVSGTVTTNEGVPTQITFEQMSTSGSLTGKVTVQRLFQVIIP